MEALSYNGEGARKFSTFTEDSMGQLVAIVLDGRILQVSSIRGKISDRGRITANVTEAEGHAIAASLKAGSLPLKLKIISESALSAGAPPPAGR